MIAPAIIAAAIGAAGSLGAGLLSRGGKKRELPQVQLPQVPTLPGVSEQDIFKTSPFAGQLNTVPSVAGSTPGLGISLGPGGANVTRNPLLTSALGRLDAGTGQAVEGFSDLIGRVGPGVGDLTNALVAANERARQRTRSDIAGSIAKRNLGGASFAQNLLTQADAEFAQQETEIRSQAFLTELQLTEQLLNDRQTTIERNVATNLQQLQLEAGIGAELSNNIFNTLNKNRQILAELGFEVARLKSTNQFNTARIAASGLSTQAKLAELQQADEAGRGKFFGDIAGTLTSAIGPEIGRAFGSSAPTFTADLPIG